MADWVDNVNFPSTDSQSSKKKNNSGDYLVWQPSVLLAVSEKIESIGKRDCPVIIRGETGTAKETLARQIHAHSNRKLNPFVPVNCGTLKGKILASQLFGLVTKDSPMENTLSLGIFRAADKGTVFLDDIDKLSIEMQAKILQVLKHHYIQPVGTMEHYNVNVRIICATAVDLREAVKNNSFLSDLYFRLNVATLELPPLRHQPDDIVILARHFLDVNARMYNEPIKELLPSAQKALSRYHWPGNVRELASIIERAFVMSRSDKISIEDLPEEIVKVEIVPPADNEDKFPGLDDVGKELVTRALEKTRGQKMAAAELLKIDHRKLNRLIKKYDLDISEFKDK
ncbi:MAG: sigma-54-dependent Fis family transcriptional regulator [Sedimentisphaerales bacterium]|nr:sigma-54-dependent Fis family transcriptional regulator [Sedimentisphaerales bacterium]